jgi:hypothetical protein
MFYSQPYSPPLQKLQNDNPFATVPINAYTNEKKNLHMVSPTSGATRIFQRSESQSVW